MWFYGLLCLKANYTTLCYNEFKEKGKHFWFAAYMFCTKNTNVNSNKIVSLFDHSRLITDKINLSVVCRKKFMDRYICLSPARKLNQPYQFIIGGSVIGSNYRCDTESQQNSTINFAKLYSAA